MVSVLAFGDSFEFTSNITTQEKKVGNYRLVNIGNDVNVETVEFYNTETTTDSADTSIKCHDGIIIINTTTKIDTFYIQHQETEKNKFDNLSDYYFQICRLDGERFSMYYDNLDSVVIRNNKITVVYK